MEIAGRRERERTEARMDSEDGYLVRCLVRLAVYSADGGVRETCECRAPHRTAHARVVRGRELDRERWKTKHKVNQGEPVRMMCVGVGGYIGEGGKLESSASFQYTRGKLDIFIRPCLFNIVQKPKSKALATSANARA